MLSVLQILSATALQLVSDPELSVHVQLAAQRTSSTCFGENYTLAVALRAAHTLTLKNEAVAGNSGAVGPVTSMKEGDLSISFGGASSISVKGDLGTTKYGIQLQDLIDGQISSMSVTGDVSLPCDNEV